MTVTVRTIQEHGNRAGTKYRKAEGDEYELDEKAAGSLAAIGLVEIVDEQSAAAAAPPPRRRHKRT